jgi:hypothetical protein
MKMTTKKKLRKTLRKKLQWTARWLGLAALPAALFGCSTLPGDSSGEGETAGGARALEIAAAATLAPNQAAGVELFVQTPYEFQTGRFDLDDVDDMNGEPLLRKRLSIPYDDLEKLIRARLDKLTAAPLEGTLDGPAGSHIYWSVALAADISFSQRGQPALTPWGSAANNGVHVDLDTQVAVSLNAHIHVHATADWIPDPPDLDVPMHALIGGHGRVDLAFFPVIRADQLQVWATLDQSDVDIIGGDEAAIGAGAVIGAGIGFVTGGSIITDAFIGAVTGEAVLEEAKDQAKDVILDEAAKAFESSRDELTKMINAVVQPQIADANDVLTSVLNQPLPGLGKTLGQLETQLGISLDIRSTTQDDMFRTVFTTRFANVPADGRQGQIDGRLRFPKRQCDYQTLGNRVLGDSLVAFDLVDANSGMHDGGCAAVDLSALLHRVYYGDNPDRALRTGAPENNLVTWASLGALQMGQMVETDDSYDCPFSITGLPSAAFLELRAAAGSALSQELSVRHLRDGGDEALDRRLHALEKTGEGRFVMVVVDGVSVTVDHTGTNPVVLDLGGKAPASTADCPSIPLSGGTGNQPDFDPKSVVPTGDSCTFCKVNLDPGAAVVNQLDQASNGSPVLVNQPAIGITAAAPSAPAAAPVTTAKVSTRLRSFAH